MANKNFLPLSVRLALPYVIRTLAGFFRLSEEEEVELLARFSSWTSSPYRSKTEWTCSCGPQHLAGTCPWASREVTKDIAFSFQTQIVVVGLLGIEYRDRDPEWKVTKVTIKPTEYSEGLEAHFEGKSIVRATALPPKGSPGMYR